MAFEVQVRHPVLLALRYRLVSGDNNARGGKPSMLQALRRAVATPRCGQRCMHLSPRELDHLQLAQVGFVAQRRLARGVRLNAPEATALIATQMLELIREGTAVSTLMETGKQLLGRRQVQAGVADMVAEVQVEGTFPDGTKLLTVRPSPAPRSPAPAPPATPDQHNP